MTEYLLGEDEKHEVRTLFCSKCNTPFANGKFSNLPIFRCKNCLGLFFKQKYLISILKKLIQEMTKDISLDYEVEPIADKKRQINCPSCQAQMNQFGYMGSHKVIIDNCDKCWHIWLDHEEVGIMAIMYAKSVKLDEFLELVHLKNERNQQIRFSIQAGYERAFALYFMINLVDDFPDLSSE